MNEMETSYQGQCVNLQNHYLRKGDMATHYWIPKIERLSNGRGWFRWLFDEERRGMWSAVGKFKYAKLTLVLRYSENDQYPKGKAKVELLVTIGEQSSRRCCSMMFARVI